MIITIMNGIKNYTIIQYIINEDVLINININTIYLGYMYIYIYYPLVN